MFLQERYEDLRRMVACKPLILQRLSGGLAICTKCSCRNTLYIVEAPWYQLVRNAYESGLDKGKIDDCRYISVLIIRKIWILTCNLPLNL
jgi:hypothetical protein